jgi:uncharacterized repeat protein (TIGR03803 family)
LAVLKTAPTTAKGGAFGYGTVFSINTTGSEHVLYSFKGYSKDGANPQAGLVEANGTLYGTAIDGGDVGCTYTSHGKTVKMGCGTAFAYSLQL